MLAQAFVRRGPRSKRVLQRKVESLPSKRIGCCVRFRHTQRRISCYPRRFPLSETLLARERILSGHQEEE